MIGILCEKLLDDVAATILRHPSVIEIAISDDALTINSNNMVSLSEWLENNYGLYLIACGNNMYHPASIIAEQDDMGNVEEVQSLAEKFDENEKEAKEETEEDENKAKVAKFIHQATNNPDSLDSDSQEILKKIMSNNGEMINSILSTLKDQSIK